MKHSSSTILVIGSSGGIGSAIVERILNEGYELIGMDRSSAPESLMRIDRYRHVTLDVRDNKALQSSIDQYVPEEGLIAVVYAAGMYDHFPLAEGPSERLENILGVNVLGFNEVLKCTFSRICASGGRYIVISSETAMVSMPFQVYGLSKRMLETYLDALQQELAFVGVPVITIRPGAHETHLLAKSRSKLADYPDTSAFREHLDAVRRTGQEVIDRGAADPKDVAEVVLKALVADKPKLRYHINVAWHFKLLRYLPPRTVRWLFRKALLKRQD